MVVPPLAIVVVVAAIGFGALSRSVTNVLWVLLGGVLVAAVLAAPAIILAQ